MKTEAPAGAAGRSARLEWQPIETLPCVGIFLFGKVGLHSVVMGWNDSTRPHGIEIEHGDIWFKPTHWMPLPAAPEGGIRPHENEQALHPRYMDADALIATVTTLCNHGRDEEAKQAVLAFLAASSAAPEIEPECEHECNAYVAQCGAKFCTYEAVQAHERECPKVASPPAPKGDVER